MVATADAYAQTVVNHLKAARFDGITSLAPVGTPDNRLKSGDGYVLTPLPLRQHPNGNVLLEEVEQELLTPKGEVCVQAGRKATAAQPQQQHSTAHTPQRVSARFLLGRR